MSYAFVLAVIQRIYYVRCDGCGVMGLPDAADEGATATEQRRDLQRELGWTRGPEGIDLCEGCTADSSR